MSFRVREWPITFTYVCRHYVQRTHAVTAFCPNTCVFIFDLAGKGLSDGFLHIPFTCVFIFDLAGTYRCSKASVTALYVYHSVVFLSLILQVPFPGTYVQRTQWLLSMHSRIPFTCFYLWSCRHLCSTDSVTAFYVHHSFIFDLASTYVQRTQWRLSTTYTIQLCFYFGLAGTYVQRTQWRLSTYAIHLIWSCRQLCSKDSVTAFYA